MSSLNDVVDIAYPQQPHCPTVLLLDTSGSMSIGGKIHDLSAGIRTFKEEIEQDDLARKRVDVAVITFGEAVSVTNGFSPVETFEPPELHADGLTPMGEAICRALDLVEERKAAYREDGIDYYRPWIFLITDGEPTDMLDGDDRWREVTARIHEGEEAGRFLFFTVGLDEADMGLLKKLSPPNRAPVRLRDHRFHEMFLWLSRSQVKVSASGPGDQIILEDFFGPDGWGEIQAF